MEQGAISRSGWVWGWLKAGLLAFGVAALIHLFVFRPYLVPTSSMKPTVIPGDFVLVSKLHYGAQTPHSLGLPFTKLFVSGLELPTFRLPGFSQLKRGDVVAFHYPAADNPVDQKLVFMKRAIGLPGDEVELREKAVYVNGKRLLWESASPPLLSVRENNPERPSNRRVYNPFIFPRGRGYTLDDYGPVDVPKKGDTITLTPDNWLLYQALIRDYEKHEIRPLEDGSFEIDGRVTNRYVVEQDYFFVLGDHRDHSLDSRIWGFVPEDHLVGKAVAVFFSWDLEAKRPRWSRMIQPIQ